jgi:hypothetical protein
MDVAEEAMYRFSLGAILLLGMFTGAQCVGETKIPQPKKWRVIENNKQEWCGTSRCPGPYWDVMTIHDGVVTGLNLRRHVEFFSLPTAAITRFYLYERRWKDQTEQAFVIEGGENQKTFRCHKNDCEALFKELEKRTGLHRLVVLEAQKCFLEALRQKAELAPKLAVPDRLALDHYQPHEKYLFPGVYRLVFLDDGNTGGSVYFLDEANLQLRLIAQIERTEELGQRRVELLDGVLRQVIVLTKEQWLRDLMEPVPRNYMRASTTELITPEHPDEVRIVGDCPWNGFYDATNDVRLTLMGCALKSNFTREMVFSENNSIWAQGKIRTIERFISPPEYRGAPPDLFDLHDLPLRTDCAK